MYQVERDNRDERLEKSDEKNTGLIDISRVIDDAWKGLQKYWIYMLVVISICSSLFYAYAKKTYHPVYKAATTFIVNTNQVINYSGDYYNKATASQLAETFPYIISNNALRHIIAEDLKVGEIPGQIFAEAMEDTNMVTISVESSDAQMAYDILQSVIKNYPKVARVVIGDTQLNIVDETGVPVVPSNPSDFKSSAVNGLVTGVILCGLFLFFYAMTRKTIRKEEDIRRMLSIKCFGSVPKARFKKRRTNNEELVLIDNKRIPYGFIEANRTIRTRVEKERRENHSHVFLITSALAGEGKTTFAANLALSLALKGKKVVLVDADMRHPSVHEVLGMQMPEFGFKEVIRGDIPLEQVMTKYKETELNLVLGSRPIKSTSRILSGVRMKNLVRKLRKEADYIIIDTPPSGLLSDASIIAGYADAGIFVVRQDYATIDKIIEGISLLADTNLHLAGCVLNQSEVGITGYGYGKGYGYGRYGYGYGRYGYGKYGYGKYGYGYGYGYHEQSKQKQDTSHENV